MRSELMGNCVFKGSREGIEKIVKVATLDGGIMELYTPITAECITGDYPGHAIFKNPTIFSEALHHKDQLQGGQLYYLLPLNPYNYKLASAEQAEQPSVVSTPYRMFTAAQTQPKPDIFPNYNHPGVWKVNLVICPQQLSQILSHHNRTEEFIDNVRTVAKCGNTLESATNSDHSTVAGSWKDKPHYGYK